MKNKGNKSFQRNTETRLRRYINKQLRRYELTPEQKLARRIRLKLQTGIRHFSEKEREFISDIESPAFLRREVRNAR